MIYLIYISSWASLLTLVQGQQRGQPLPVNAAAAEAGNGGREMLTSQTRRKNRPRGRRPGPQPSFGALSHLVLKQGSLVSSGGQTWEQRGRRFRPRGCAGLRTSACPDNHHDGLVGIRCPSNVGVHIFPKTSCLRGYSRGRFTSLCMFF